MRLCNIFYLYNIKCIYGKYIYKCLTLFYKKNIKEDIVIGLLKTNIIS